MVERKNTTHFATHLFNILIISFRSPITLTILQELFFILSWLVDPHLKYKKTASLADNGNSAYFQSNGEHSIKHI